MRTRVGWLSFAGCVLPVVLQFACPAAFAQSQVTSPIDEIVVVGTRRLGRTIADSPVPVDVFTGEAFRNIGTDDVNDILRTLIPAYNVQRYALHDASSLVRPAELRGLPPGNTLVLINGKRLHRSAVLAEAVGGGQGPDMMAISTMALQRVELLRDGSSAQYGSDAIAGVINMIMRDEAEGVAVQYETGQFYAGDGRAGNVGINIGMPLIDAGFLNLSLEYGNSEKTVRSEQRFDARALEQLGAEGIPDPAQSYGQPILRDHFRLFANAARPLGEDFEVYGFGHYARRKPEIEFFWRNPNNQHGVYTSNLERLVFDLTPDGSGNCPAAGTARSLPVPDFFFPSQSQYEANEEAIAALSSDPGCWVVNELYPSGYRPAFGADIADWSAAAGIRAEYANGLRLDLSAIRGESEVDYALANSINVSLGPGSPTSFRPGSNVQSETSVNVDVALPVDFGLFHSPLNVAAGLEWREESFRTLSGDEASWLIGPLHEQGSSIGSHGYPGYPPSQAGKWDRSNQAAYLDLEADVTERLLLGVAVRYEDFEDFGSTTNTKGAIRFRFSEAVSLRASASGGFRAPTPGQSNQTRLTTEIFAGELRQVGLIPPADAVARLYGGRELEPEESSSISAGFTVQPRDNLAFAVDWFRIDVEDRISIGPNFFLTPEDVEALVRQGVPGASDFAFVKFFGNQAAVRTEGFDAVASWAIDWETAGSTGMSLAWNRTEVAPRRLVNPDRGQIVGPRNMPHDRGVLTVEHSWRSFRFLVRASYYDSWVVPDSEEGPPVPVCTNDRPNPPETDECYGSIWLADVEIGYTFGGRYSVVIGADNVFDAYPDEAYDYPVFSFGERYPGSSPIGYNGGYWYVRLGAQF